jgi:hypothetical protein
MLLGGCVWGGGGGGPQIRHSSCILVKGEVFWYTFLHLRVLMVFSRRRTIHVCCCGLDTCSASLVPGPLLAPQITSEYVASNRAQNLYYLGVVSQAGAGTAGGGGGSASEGSSSGVAFMIAFSALSRSSADGCRVRASVLR